MTDEERCYASALRILGYRFNSEVELRRKLRAKKFEKEIIDATIVRLRKEKWLDDERFAGAFVRTRGQRRIGAKRILRELHAAGVQDEVAERAVAENVDAEAEAERLREAFERRARVLARRHGEEYLTSPEGRKKLMAYLVAQGFEAALAYELCFRAAKDASH